MTQKRRRRSKKWILKLFILVLIVAAVVVCYLVWKAYFGDKKIKQPDEKKDSSVVVDKKEEEKKDEEKPEEEVIEKEKVIQYDGDDPNEANELTGVLTHVGITGDNLIIRVNIDQYLNGGKCTLGLRRDGMNIYSAESAIIDAVSTSTCEGFNVPIAELGQGHTIIRIFLESNGKTGEISGEVDL